MKKKLTLSDYVKRQNGLPMGAKGSLSIMLNRSLGAESFSKFWQYWNPIWGYYLGKFIYAPLKPHLGRSGAILATFTVSGALHDLAVMLLKWKLFFHITPWFFFMGLSVLITSKFQFQYKTQPWLARALINSSFIFANLGLVIGIKYLLA